MASFLRLGLTGGIGSGKSTVAAVLARRGVPVVDADAIARACTAAGGSAMPAIAQTFGPEFVDASGALDRERMRALAFADPLARQRLEAIVHPLVGQAIAAAVDRAAAQGARAAVLDIPLLVESGHWRAKLDHVLVVDCSEATQVERVVRRNGMAEAQVRAIIATQASRRARLAAADAVVFNDGIPLEALATLTRQWAAQFGL